MRGEMMEDLINRQVAINGMRFERRINDDGLLFVPFRDVKKHLESLPSAQPELCEDAVSRKAIQYLLAHFVDEDKYVAACVGLEHLPPVTPKQRTGYWIDDGSELGCQCSECGKSLDEYIHATECMTLIEIPKLCPNCGAKMEGTTDADTNTISKCK